MEGTLVGTDSWFHNPDSRVSTHFGVGKDGTVLQWVDTAEVARAQRAYNEVGISIEHEGKSGDSLTDAQVAADRALLAWISANHGVPLVRNQDRNGHGVIGHGELGVAGGENLDCPGQPILDQIPSLLSTPARRGQSSQG
jgi:N-acetyl-anhydromuramyl-L-alanine amidase AmpD